MNQSGSNGYFQPQYGPNSGQTYLQDPGYILQSVTSDLRSLMVENSYLRSQNEMAISELNSIKEEAYSSITEKSNQLWVADKRNVHHRLLDASFDSVSHFLFDPIYNMEPCYIIHISNNPEPAYVSDKDFKRPEQLLNVLAQACGMTFHLYVSKRRTGELLQQHLLQKAREEIIPFYLGWHFSENAWRFELINDTTHGTLDSVSPYHSDYHPAQKLSSPAALLLAAEKLISLLEVIDRPDIRCTLCLWMHAAVLYSLLRGLGDQIPIGLCLYTPDAKVRRYLESLMSWFGDPAINLLQQAKSFMQSLASRKDQPLVIRNSTSQTGNDKLFLHIVESGEIPLKINKDISSLRLQSLPTVISGCANILSVSSRFATIDLEADSIAAHTGERLETLKQYIPDYLNYFTHYVTEHIEELRNLISRGIETVLDNGCGFFNDDGVKTLGIMQGIQQFLKQFFFSLAPDEQMEKRISVFLEPANLQLFESALRKTASYGCDSEDIVSRFLFITNKMIDKQQFDMCSTHGVTSICCPDDSEQGSLYYDDTCYSFSGRAFQRICARCGETRPALLRALQEAGLLKGQGVNSETSKTRITIWDVNGNSKVIPVYNVY